MKHVWFLAALSVGSFGCKTTGSQVASDSGLPVPAGGLDECGEANLPLRGYEYATADGKLKLTFLADGETVKFQRAKKKIEELKFLVTDGGLQCLVVITHKNGKADQFYIGASYEVLRNRDESIILTRTTSPKPQFAAESSPVLPVPSGSAPIDCSEVNLPLRGFEYISTDNKLRISFLDDGERLIYDFRQPIAPGQGTIPQVLSYFPVNLGLSCGIMIQWQNQERAEYFSIGAEFKALESKEGDVLNRTTNPEPR
jgi:hypothetical protein